MTDPFGPPRRGLSDELFSDSSSSSSSKNTPPKTILVCPEDKEYFTYDGEWDVCPKCGADLEEVEKA